MNVAVRATAVNPPECFHDEVFHLLNRETRLMRDGLEAHRAIVCGPREHALDERH